MIVNGLYTNKHRIRIMSHKKNASKFQQRIIRDVEELYKYPLEIQGIYYKHDNDDIQKGYAMIIGPKETPYENGVYLFEFYFKETYPSEPPIVRCLNGDGITTLNPNIYIEGKVCLSILNTWHDEMWLSCRTIRSVLLSLISIFNEYPLKNEPGFEHLCNDHPKIVYYNEFIKYKNFEIGILKSLSSPSMIFIDEIQSHFSNKKDEILFWLIENAKLPVMYSITNVYENTLNIKMDYKKLLKPILDSYRTLTNSY